MVVNRLWESSGCTTSEYIPIQCANRFCTSVIKRKKMKMQNAFLVFLENYNPVVHHSSIVHRSVIPVNSSFL